MKDLSQLKFICFIVVLAAAINWLPVGLFKKDFISLIFGFNFFSRLIYIFFGAAAGYLIYLWAYKKEKFL